MALSCGCDIDVKSCPPYASLESVQQIVDNLCTNCSGTVPQSVTNNEIKDYLMLDDCCNMYIVTRGSDVLFSTDGGTNWYPVNTVPYYRGFATLGSATINNGTSYLFNTNVVNTGFATAPLRPLTEGYYLATVNMEFLNVNLINRYVGITLAASGAGYRYFSGTKYYPFNTIANLTHSYNATNVLYLTPSADIVATTIITDAAGAATTATLFQDGYGLYQYSLTLVKVF